MIREHAGKTGKTARRTVVVSVFLGVLLCLGGYGLWRSRSGAAEGPSAEQLGWAAEGRFAVVEWRDWGAETTSAVGITVLDTATGQTRSVNGYHVVALEPAAPVAWMVPVSGSDVAVGYSDGEEAVLEGWTALDDRLDDGWDTKPKRLFAWRLDDTAADPTDASESRWRPWTGAAARSVLLEIDVLKGALPSRARFEPSDSRTLGVAARLPGDVSTFETLGFSASGRFFGVREALASDAEEVRAPRTFILSATDGSVVASCAVEGAAAWDGEQDVLWVLELRAVDDAMLAGALVRVLEPGGALQEPRWETPQIVLDSGWLLGRDVEGPIVGAWSEAGVPEYYRLAVEGANRIRTPSGNSFDYLGVVSPDGRVLFVDDSDTEGKVVVTDLDGGGAAVVWSPGDTGRRR